MPIDKSRLDLFIAPWQAARQLGLDMESISQAINAGKLNAAVMTDGTIGISQQSVNALLPREALPEYQENASLQGVPISINEAGRRYSLNTSTLTRWMQRRIDSNVGKIREQNPVG